MFLSRLAYGLGASGNRKKALKVLDQLTRISEDTFVSPFSLAIIHLGLGDYEKAIPYLEKAFAEKMYHMLLLKTDPLFEPVRSDPRIKKLLLKLGFPVS
jgi:tetratricopeptide (TPR) repeat protein